MPVAQVIRFDERLAIGRPQRRPEPAYGVVLHFPTPKRSNAEPVLLMIPDDSDGIAGRGRDPG